MAQSLYDGLPQMSGMIPPLSRLSQLNLNSVELPFYQHLFTLADCQGFGYVDGAAGASFLQTSGLPRPLLHEIWRLADISNSGFLDFEGFSVACRLVAHAQSGLPISNECIILEPPSLPMFDLSVARTPSEQSGLESVHGFGSVSGGGGRGAVGTAPPLGTMMDPNMAAAAMVTGPGDGATTPPLMSPSHFASSHSQQMFPSTGGFSAMDGSTAGGVVDWTLTEADRQKYMNVFQATDANADGFIEGLEAKQLFSMSGVPDADLMQIWNIADQDCDGRLNLNEFAVAMHLVTKRKRGAPIPNAGLPMELLAVLSNGLPNHRQLVTQPIGGLLLPSDKSAPLQPAGADLAVSAWEATPSPQDALAVTPSTEQPLGFGDESDLSEKSKKKKTKKKEKAAREGKQSREQDLDERESEEPSFGDLVRDETEKEKTKPRGSRLSLSPTERRTPSDDEDSRKPGSSRGTRGLRDTLRGNWRESPATLIEGVIEADKRISRTLAEDVDNHDKDLRRLNEVSAALKREIVKEKSELERQLERKRDFEAEAENVRLQLEKLKEERRKIDLERISLNRDIDHYQEETLFLQQLVEEVQTDIRLLTESNQMLDKSYNQTDRQIRSLDLARRNVLDSLRDEKELLKKEERDISELKNTLERMRREKEDAQSKQSVLQEKLRQQDWMQYRVPALSSVNSLSPGGLEGGSRLYPCRALEGLAPVPQGPRMALSPSQAAGVGPSGRSYAQLRDSKGIPAGAPAASPGSSQTAYMSTGSVPSKDEALLSTGGDSPVQPQHWTMFGSTPSKGSERTAGRRGELEKRGVEGILGSDLLGLPRAEFSASKDYIGSRRTDKQFSTRLNDNLRDVPHTAKDRESNRLSRGTGRLSDSVGLSRATGYASSTSDSDERQNHKRRSCSSRSSSTSRRKTAAGKEREPELEVRFSDNLDLDSKQGGRASSGGKSKRDRKGKSSTKSGFPDESEVRLAGLETPSFGARSGSQSNSVVSH